MLSNELLDESRERFDLFLLRERLDDVRRNRGGVTTTNGSLCPSQLLLRQRDGDPGFGHTYIIPTQSLTQNTGLIGRIGGWFRLFCVYRSPTPLPPPRRTSVRGRVARNGHGRFA